MTETENQQTRVLDFSIRWSLNKLKFVESSFARISDSIEDILESHPETDEASHYAIRKMQEFRPMDSFENISTLVGTGIELSENLPYRVFGNLSPFYSAGLLLESTGKDKNYYLTQIFHRGQVFPLDIKDQILTKKFVPKQSPLGIKMLEGIKVMKHLDLDFLPVEKEATAFLISPTPTCSMVLISEKPKPWALTNIEIAQGLVNNAFSQIL